MKSAFKEAPQIKKNHTLAGIYTGLVVQLIPSVTFSSWLRTAQLEFIDGHLYIFAISVGSILGLIAMPLYGFFGVKNPAKIPLICVSLLIGSLVLLGRALAPIMLLIAAVSAFWGFVSAGINVLGFTVIVVVECPVVAEICLLSGCSLTRRGAPLDSSPVITSY